MPSKYFRDRQKRDLEDHRKRVIIYINIRLTLNIIFITILYNIYNLA